MSIEKEPNSADAITNLDKSSVQPQQLDTTNDILKILDGEFASTANVVYVNSLDQEVTFKEVTVQQQKSLTRIMAANQNRKDIIYDAQCSMLNSVAVTEGFNIYSLSEFDRLKLMIALYQANMFQNQVKFTCDECGVENVYSVDFDNVIKRLDSFDLTPKTFQYKNKRFIFDFTVKYPDVKTVSAFHKSYCQTHTKKVPRRELKTDENLQNMEYVNLFIDKVVWKNIETGKSTEIEFRKFPVGSIEKILEKFPQDVLYAESGVLKFIVNELIKPVNDSFDKHECYNCHTIHEKENQNQAESFF